MKKAILMIILAAEFLVLICGMTGSDTGETAAASDANPLAKEERERTVMTGDQAIDYLCDRIDMKPSNVMSIADLDGEMKEIDEVKCYMIEYRTIDSEINKDTQHYAVSIYGDIYKRHGWNYQLLTSE